MLVATMTPLQEYVRLFKFSAAKADYWKMIPVPKNRLGAFAYRVRDLYRCCCMPLVMFDMY